MEKKLSVWLLWPFTVFLLGVWHLLDVQASVTETGHCWLYGWYGGLFFVSLAMLIGMGTLLFGKNGKNLVIFPVNQGKKWFQEKKIGNFQVCSLELSCVLAFYI